MKKKSAIRRVIQWFGRITGFSTPFGGISWIPSESKYADVPIFDSPILLTSDGNDGFISFLDKNSGKIIFLCRFREGVG